MANASLYISMYIMKPPCKISAWIFSLRMFKAKVCGEGVSRVLQAFYQFLTVDILKLGCLLEDLER